MIDKLKVYARTIEDEAVQQIDKMNGCDAYKDCLVRIMPDCHAGDPGVHRADGGSGSGNQALVQFQGEAVTKSKVKV